MDPSINEGRQFIFNLNFTKVVYLYQILKPNNATKIFGYKISHIVISSIALPMLIVSMLSPIGLYHVFSDLIVFTVYFGFVNNFLFSCYKMMNILYYSKDLWKCLDAIRSNFTSYQQYNRNIFTKWQKRFSRVIYTYATIYSIVLFIWIFSPYVFDAVAFTDINEDSPNNKTRSNIFNVYLVASGETYNKYFFIFYLIETMLSFGYVYYSILFDIVITVVCFGLSCRLEAVSDAIQSLGHAKPLTNNLSTRCLCL